MKEELPYNPLDKKNLGKSVADALLLKEMIPLGDLEQFMGAGIYAIYYTGDFDAYRSIACNITSGPSAIPVYVGKAVPPGARKGNVGLNGGKPTPDLHKRLQEHAKSIIQAENLNVDDFLCRYLVVDDIWIPLGESLLITSLFPVWNKLIDGFGNHDPGKGRYKQARSRWDTLHPGRKWAEKLPKRDETVTIIKSELKAYFQNSPC
ncbi:MAG: Eco29kI family restriction endonuclease [Desulfobacteraceae bacterium]|nr:Eco29kI family restriction endonuclease [Desulfobacteraceae bacterium]